MGNKPINHSVLELIAHLTRAVDDILFDLSMHQYVSETTTKAVGDKLKDIYTTLEMLDVN